MLGPVVAGSSQTTAALGGPRQRAVLAMLALAAPDQVSVHRIVDGLWGEEPPAKPQATLQVFVHHLRKALRAVAPDRELIVWRGGGYRLMLEPGELDVHRFVALRDRARSLRADGRNEDAARAFEEALRLWHGPALSDVREAPFAEAEAVRLDELRLLAEEESVEVALALGRHAELVPLLEERVRDHPVRERLWAQLMIALYRSDRQAEALEAYGRARDRLADELGIDPGEALRQLEIAVLRQDPSLNAPVAPVLPPIAAASPQPPAPGAATAAATPRPRDVGRLPLLTGSTVGRDALLATVTAAVLDPEQRLVVLTGTGGVGKSRVAAVAAARCAQTFAGGVRYLGAAGRVDADGFAGELRHLLTGTDGDEAEALATLAPTLVVLDDLENLDAMASLVSDLLSRAPTLTVLATTRIGLDVPGARELVVEPLSPPDAVALFCDRWGSVPSDARRSAQVEELCRVLDGLPLAVELAGARARMLSPEAVLAALSPGARSSAGGLDFLSPAGADRHGLGAVVGWSLDRLDPAARLVCRRLALFEQGFTLEAAEAVCPEVPSVLDALARLLDVRLIRSSPSRVEVRLCLLGTVRAVLRAESDDPAHLDDARTRWAQHLLERLARERGALDGPECALVLGRFDDDAADVAALHAWAVNAGLPDLAEDLALAAHDLMIASGRLHEGLAALEATAALRPPSAALLAAIGKTQYYLTDWGRTAAACRAALSAAEVNDCDVEAVATARTYLAGALAVTGETAEARTHAEIALSVARSHDLYPLQAVSLSMLAIAAAVSGDFDEEQRRYAERLSLVRAREDLARLADTLNTLAEIALDEVDADLAGAYAEEAWRMTATVLPLESRDALITLARADRLAGSPASAATRIRAALRLNDITGQTLATAQSLRVGGCLAQAMGSPREAVRLFAAAQTLSPSPSGGEDPVEHDLADGLSRARTDLGEEAARREWTVGVAVGTASARTMLESVLDRAEAMVVSPDRPVA